MSWSPQEVRRLKALYGTKTDSEVARSLRRPVAVVRAKAKELALAKDKRAFPGRTTMPRWDQPSVALLTELFPVTPAVEIAQRLGRSVKAVNGKAATLGLRKQSEYLTEMGRRNVRNRRARSAR